MTSPLIRTPLVSQHAQGAGDAIAIRPASVSPSLHQRPHEVSHRDDPDEVLLVIDDRHVPHVVRKEDVDDVRGRIGEVDMEHLREWGHHSAHRLLRAVRVWPRAE